MPHKMFSTPRVLGCAPEAIESQHGDVRAGKVGIRSVVAARSSRRAKCGKRPSATKRSKTARGRPSMPNKKTLRPRGIVARNLRSSTVLIHEEDTR